jgi:hypothetical protein
LLLGWGAEKLDLEMKIEVRQGIPVYTELTLRARPDGPEIRDKDLESLYLGEWLEEIVAGCSWTLPTESGRTLILVAEVYREHVSERPTEAVSRVFGVSHRTAARYVQQARESGHLPETTPGKRKA